LVNQKNIGERKDKLKGEPNTRATSGVSKAHALRLKKNEAAIIDKKDDISKAKRRKGALKTFSRGRDAKAAPIEKGLCKPTKEEQHHTAV